MLARKKILLVEDDLSLANLLHDSLLKTNYDVIVKRNEQEALTEFKSDRYNMCLLDVAIPGKDGFALARNLHAFNPDVPIVFLTAKALKEDAVEGIKLGARDYIIKPFVMEELILRMDNIFKRAPKAEVAIQDKFKISSFVFDPSVRSLKIGVKELKLTIKESGLLKMLVAYTGRILEREVALNAVWGTDSYFAGRSMDVYISRLRKYLREDPNIIIQNIHGTGFKLIVFPEKG